MSSGCSPKRHGTKSLPLHNHAGRRLSSTSTSDTNPPGPARPTRGAHTRPAQQRRRPPPRQARRGSNASLRTGAARDTVSRRCRSARRQPISGARGNSRGCCSHRSGLGRTAGSPLCRHRRRTGRRRHTGHSHTTIPWDIGSRIFRSACRSPLCRRTASHTAFDRGSGRRK
jgi:hypothetical protein